MSRGIPQWTDDKNTTYTVHSQERVVAKTVSKTAQPIMAETDCDVVHCPTVGETHWTFDPLLADVVNIFVHYHWRKSIVCAGQVKMEEP